MRKTLLILFLALSYFIYNKLESSGVFKDIKNNFKGTVSKVYDNMPGTEDIDVDRERGWMFISSADRWSLRATGKTNTDGIYLLMPDSSTEATKIPTTFIGEFHPHGISYFKQDSASYLYVINHNSDGDFVELFEYKNDTLWYMQSIQNQSMCCPNDIVGVDTKHFYVTNDHANKTGFMRKLEDYAGLAQSYLLYYDDGVFSIAFENLQYANGVNISNDGTKLYVTHTTGGELFIIDRDVATGKLAEYEAIDLNTGADNIDVDENGDLWIGCHPQLLKFVGHAKGPENLSPSQVLKVSPIQNYKVDEIYINDGSELSGSSVGVQYKGDLYIGVVFESKVLRGKLNSYK